MAVLPNLLTAAAPAEPNLMMAFIPLIFTVAIVSLTFFGLKALHKKRHPEEQDVNETNRQRREREKLKRQTTEKVNAALSGKPGEKEHVPNGLRSGKHNKKKKR